ncbi:SDR family oxidoreductase [Nocardia sp. NBC_01503]|uniref:SDR family oxidoreductase n=1 Tax=Nocardia sp. NBC_01503 TaxID=2975997 RepID=UPI002E7B8D73|nr:SDR family oxidoreductase [Nocardia sp. NBC_01503]WTL31189.1 SDR family oxidoreductase [Nocardia sp. NBC_01503]
MDIFITGATGWIGSSVADHLLAAGHTVTGLARSDASADALERKGIRVLRGGLDDLDILRAGADKAEAVVHLANKHDFTNPAVMNKAERDTVQTIGDTLAGSPRPFALASGLFCVAPGRIATELDRSPFHGVDSSRGGSENLALELAQQGVRTIVTRFAPSVHGAGDYGFVAGLVGIARAKGVSAYIDDGANRWAAVHRLDAGRLVQLAVDERTPAGAILHAAAETGIGTREIAEAIGRGLRLPVVSIPAAAAGEHFGWLSRFFGTDMAASSAATSALLGWKPEHPTLFEDLDSGYYYL